MADDKYNIIILYITDTTMDVHVITVSPFLFAAIVPTGPSEIRECEPSRRNASVPLAASQGVRSALVAPALVRLELPSLGRAPLHGASGLGYLVKDALEIGVLAGSALEEHLGLLEHVLRLVATP